jgi:hypothetical protein
MQDNDIKDKSNKVGRRKKVRKKLENWAITWNPRMPR